MEIFGNEKVAINFRRNFRKYLEILDFQKFPKIFGKFPRPKLTFPETYRHTPNIRAFHPIVDAHVSRVRTGYTARTEKIAQHAGIWIFLIFIEF